MLRFRMSRRISILILLALTLAIYLGNAAEPALLDDVDAGHAIASREMLERRDWAVMHINGVPWLEKAPLHYWLVAASYAVLSEGEFSTRLPLGLAVAGLVLMVYAFGRHFFGERAGFYAGLVMCTSMGTFLFTRTMIPEAIYALEFTAAFYLFLRAWTGTASLRAGYWGFAAMVALAVMTRALIGVVFPLAVITLFLLFTGEWRRWRELPVVSSALVFLTIAAPWHLIVGLRVPGFFWFYFINEQVLRAVGARYPADYISVPLIFWWAAHLLWFFPWSFFLSYALQELPKAAELKQGLDSRGQARLLLFLWAGFILLFFSVFKRLEYYSFGAYPAVAILLGLGLERAEEEGNRWLPRLQGAMGVLGLVLAGVLTALLLVPGDGRAPNEAGRLLLLKDEYFTREALTGFIRLVRAYPGLRAAAVVSGISILLGLCVPWLLRRRGQALAAGLATAMGMAGFFFAANLALGAFEPEMSSRPLARAILPHLRPDDQIAIYGEFYGGSSIGFYTQRKTWIYNGRYSGLEFGSYSPDAPKIFLTDSDFPRLWNGPQRVFLFVPEKLRREAGLRLPADSTYLLAESGGKAVYVNRPVRPGQATVAESGSGTGGAER